MILAALVPPLWRRVMDHRVIAHYGGDVSRINVQPGVVVAQGTTSPS